MKYNFNQYNNRRNTASKKWDTTQDHFNSDKKLLPMWVADMDFKSPEPVIEALRERVEQGIYGYTVRTDDYLNSIIDWFIHRHNWVIEKEWISHSPGIIPALSLILQSFTAPNDKVVLQSPVHHAFYRVVNLQGRKVVENKLQEENGYYTMDLDDLEKKFLDGAKVLFLCSPHNPVGRVWSRKELQKLGNLCTKYNVLVVSDEVWCDLVFKPNKHTPYADISKEFADNSITCIGPSKTFNLMGLKSSAIIIPNDDLRKEFEDSLNALFLGAPNYFGVAALEASYKKGEEWLNQLLQYLKINIEFIEEFLEKFMPYIRMHKPEGTYLAWLDFQELGLEDQDLKKKIIDEANLGLDDGPIFGAGGAGFMRLNFACPKSFLEKGLHNLYNALNKKN